MLFTVKTSSDRLLKLSNCSDFVKQGFEKAKKLLLVFEADRPIVVKNGKKDLYDQCHIFALEDEQIVVLIVENQLIESGLFLTLFEDYLELLV